MAKQVTIYEIAKEAGVSPSTAARILSGRSQGRAKTRAAVLAAAKRLNYQLNLAAQNLSRGKSMSIGVLVPDIADPFFVEILRGIEKGLHNSAYFPLIGSMHWRLGEARNALDLLLGHRVGGLIVATTHLPPERLYRVAQEMPLLLIGELVEPIRERCLAIDNEEAAYRATRHLIDLGHRRIAYISGPPLHWHTTPRLAGYRRALEEAGLELQPELVLAGNYEESSGYHAMKELIRRGIPFSAVFASNDAMAYGARLALFESGLAVPEQVSLVGFDDLPWSSYLIPPLTTVRQPGYEMGLSAARGVLQMLSGQPFQPPRFYGELVVRNSSGQAP